MPQLAGDFHRVMNVTYGFIRLVHLTIGNAQCLQNESLFAPDYPLNRQA